MLSRDIIYACINAVENKAGIEYKQNMLADDMGVRPQRITELCRNKDANIGIETAKKLSAALYKYGIENDEQFDGRY